MNYKYRITNNTAAARSGANKRNIFVAVAGKMVKPGEFCHSLRIDQATKNLQETKDLIVEEGNFSIGVDLTPKPKQNAVVDLDDQAPPPFRPPVSKSADEPLSPREDSLPKVTVSSMESGKVPIAHSPSEPFKDRWQGEKRAVPPVPLAKEDMPERFVMPPREGTTEKVAEAATDKGGVAPLSSNFDPDNDAPNFGGSDPSGEPEPLPPAPTPAPATGSFSKGGKKSKG